MPAAATSTVMVSTSAEMKNWRKTSTPRVIPHHVGDRRCRTSISWSTTNTSGGMTRRPTERWPWATFWTTSGE